MQSFQLPVVNRGKDPSLNGETDGSTSEEREPVSDGSKRQHYFTYLPRKAIQIYGDYASRLWRETNKSARKKIASDKVTQSVRTVQQVFRGEEYCDFSDVSSVNRQNLLDACDSILNEKIERSGDASSEAGNETTEIATTDGSENKAATKKKGRSVLFGATMGAAVACWVFSGNYIFTGLFTLMTILGQLEYYRMVMNKGVYPSRTVSVIGAASMFLSALFAPNLHQICLPMFGLWAIVQLLADRNSSPSISDIATTFTGMFYLGYVPSFWVRIRLQGSLEPTRLAPLAAPILAFLKNSADTKLPNFIPKAIHLPITGGAIFIFWSWLSLAFSDVGAYFVGRRYGKTKLSAVSAAAGKTSPNKTVEGVIGGCLVSAFLSTIGAWVQKWPYWQVTGAVHGLLLGFLGLIGDLTASMLKRDAGVKDFGDLIPEHGGIMDRVDSFVWSAPYSWFVFSTILPALRATQ